MKKLLLSASAISMLVASGVASATCESNRFDGFYAGGNLGIASHESTWTDRDNWIDNFSNDFNSSEVTRSDMGFAGGVQGGYNWQHECALLGVEMDVSRAVNMDNSPNYSPSPAGTTLTLEDSIDWYGTLRARAGVAVDSLVLYVTGGIAYANVKHAWTIVDPGPATEHGSSTGAWGLVVGAGAEWAVTPRVSIRAEGQYMDFANDTTSMYSTAGAQRVTFDTKDSLLTGRIGVNMKF